MKNENSTHHSATSLAIKLSNSNLLLKIYITVATVSYNSFNVKLMGLGKEKRMFTAIRSSYLYLESLKNAALDYEKEWGFSFVYSDKNKLEGNAVVMDVGLS